MIEKDPFDLAKKIVQYRTDELTPIERQEFEEQLANDPKLRALFDELSNPVKVQQELQQLEFFDAKNAFKQAQEEVAPVRLWSWNPYAWIAASIAVVVGISFVLLRMLSPSAPRLEVLLTQQDTTDGVQLMLATGQRIQTDTLSFIRANETEFRGNDSVLHVQSMEDAQPTDINKIIVPFRKKYQIVLSDGSKVFLNAGSTLTFPAVFAPDERRVHLEGEAYFEVAPMSNKRFVVETGQQQIRVYGTIFNIKAYDNEPIHYTTLIEGQISVQSRGKEQFLQPGNQAQFEPSTGATSISMANTAIAASWKDGWLAFDNLPMSEILRQIGRWYNLEIALADRSLHNMSVTGKILLYPDVNDVLRKFEKLDDISLQATEDKVIAKRSNNT
ncbi:FecR domain-containing protein [Sphingobacterium faecale]|uniref:FecR domain-containing protein n=1 Tax=Sphingobacterium faecale TaxID=2803775 RepID=A0ABS1R517_9SPHI|nr:FecR domain-containing protein [Sphingobacterium faecale]MBL1409801.1 FecR domain-containing protein [Sphingobacterium faecale]